jgi:formylmethanofuran dehydrogenase subunit E
MQQTCCGLIVRPSDSGYLLIEEAVEMPLTGQAKVDYQRDYMRRRRANQPAPPPKPAWEPPQSLIRAKAIPEARRQEQATEREREAEAAQQRRVKCSFCGEPSSPTRIVVGDGRTRICDVCVDEAVKVIAAHRKALTQS